MPMKSLGTGLLKIQQNFGRYGTKSSARELMPMLRCLVAIQTNRLQRFASHFKAEYYLSVDDSAAVDEFLYKHENYVASNSKTADADKLCTEVSIELKMWDNFK